MKTPAPTPVLGLLRLVWQNANKGTGHSWERLNHAMYQALRLCIGSGFPFVVDDFRKLTDFSVGRWIGDSAEWCYSLAVAENNATAQKAFEEWRGREPLIADDVTPAKTAGFAHLTGTRQRERLHVGCRFPWQGEDVTLTSFAADGSATACSYHQPPKGRCAHKVKRRYRITREAILAERAERKERKDIETRLTALATAGQVTALQILNELGCKTRAEYDAVPLKVLRRAAEKILAAAG